MSKKLCIGFSLLEISYWCFSATFIGFVSAYLLHKGISSTMVSICIALYLFSAFIGSFVWGGICDKYHTNKKVYIGGVIGTGVLMYLVYFLGGNIAITIITYPLLGFISLPLSSNMDAWILSTCNQDTKIYGKIRSTPSFMYAVVVAIFAPLVSNYGYYFMLIDGCTYFFCTYAGHGGCRNLCL